MIPDPLVAAAGAIFRAATAHGVQAVEVVCWEGKEITLGVVGTWRQASNLALALWQAPELGGLVVACVAKEGGPA